MAVHLVQSCWICCPNSFGSLLASPACYIRSHRDLPGEGGIWSLEDKMQCKSDPTLHYWKSAVANLSAHISSQVQALNPTTLASMKPHIDVLHTKPVGCILLTITQLINPANATNPGPPVIMLVAAPYTANIGLQSKDNTPGILYEDL
jgi:hypothetical protein